VYHYEEDHLATVVKVNSCLLQESEGNMQITFGKNAEFRC